MAVRQEDRQDHLPGFFIVMAMCVIPFCRQAFSSFVWLPIELWICGIWDAIWNRISAWIWTRIWNWTWAFGLHSPEASITFFHGLLGPGTLVFPLHFCRFRGQSSANAHGKLDSTVWAPGWFTFLLSSWKGVKTSPLLRSSSSSWSLPFFCCIFRRFFMSLKICVKFADQFHSFATLPIYLSAFDVLFMLHWSRFNSVCLYCGLLWVPGKSLNSYAWTPKLRRGKCLNILTTWFDWFLRGFLNKKLIFSTKIFFEKGVEI